MTGKEPLRVGRASVETVAYESFALPCAKLFVSKRPTAEYGVPLCRRVLAMTKRTEGTCGRILCFVVLAAWHDRRAVRFSVLRLVRIFSLACHDPDESLRLFREMLLK